MQAQKIFAGWLKCLYRPTLAICPNHVLLCSVAAFPRATFQNSSCGAEALLFWDLLRQTRRSSQARARQSASLFSPLSSLLSPLSSLLESKRLDRFSIIARIAFRLPGKLSGKNGQSLVSQPAKAFTNHGYRRRLIH